ncbi:MAG: DUF5681 domain-containing protein [Candidatus Saccharimonadales bacterium]
MGNNSGLTVGNNNLKPWQPGQSGNPNGRPKGSKNLKSIISNILDDTSSYDNLTDWEQQDRSKTPAQAIVLSLASKALNGDIRAADLLFRFGYDTSAPDNDDRPTSITVRFVGEDDEEDDDGNPFN